MRLRYGKVMLSGSVLYSKLRYSYIHWYKFITFTIISQLSNLAKISLPRYDQSSIITI